MLDPAQPPCPPSPVRSSRHEAPNLLRLPVQRVRGLERRQQGSAAAAAAAARLIPRPCPSSSCSPCSPSASRCRRRSCFVFATPLAVVPQGGSVATFVRRSAFGNWRLRLYDDPFHPIRGAKAVGRFQACERSRGHEAEGHAGQRLFLASSYGRKHTLQGGAVAVRMAIEHVTYTSGFFCKLKPSQVLPFDELA